MKYNEIQLRIPSFRSRVQFFRSLRSLAYQVCYAYNCAKFHKYKFYYVLNDNYNKTF